MTAKNARIFGKHYRRVDFDRVRDGKITRIATHWIAAADFDRVVRARRIAIEAGFVQGGHVVTNTYGCND